MDRIVNENNLRNLKVVLNSLQYAKTECVYFTTSYKYPKV